VSGADGLAQPSAVLDDLRVPPGNRLEGLKGDRNGQHSIRINDQWPICFTWTETGHEIVHGKRCITADTALRSSTIAPFGRLASAELGQPRIAGDRAFLRVLHQVHESQDQQPVPATGRRQAVPVMVR
jgi:hypothetical protein